MIQYEHRASSLRFKRMIHINAFCPFIKSLSLSVVGAEAQTGQKPQDAHYCICWQPSGGQRKRCELSSDISRCVMHIIGYVLPSKN